MVSTTRRSPLVRFTTVALAVVAGVLLAVVIDVIRTGGPSAWLARHHLAPPYDDQGERFDIGDRSLYLDCRGAGQPTVILEAGSGADSATWSAVIGSLAETTRTCAYDRAGRGRSDAAERQTLADAASELRALLTTAGEPGPFMLVGHSLGGAYARVFAGEYPGEVVGLVMVDTFDPDLQTDWIHPLVNELRAEYDARLDNLRNTVTVIDSLDWPASEAQMRAVVPLNVPIEVVVAPRYEPRLSEARNAEIATAWRSAYDSLSPRRVRWTTAWGAGHNVQIDRPDLVIEAVRRLIAGARASQ